jgi:hypothetical protein
LTFSAPPLALSLLLAGLLSGCNDEHYMKAEVCVRVRNCAAGSGAPLQVTADSTITINLLALGLDHDRWINDSSKDFGLTPDTDEYVCKKVYSGSPTGSTDDDMQRIGDETQSFTERGNSFTSALTLQDAQALGLPDRLEATDLVVACDDEETSNDDDMPRTFLYTCQFRATFDCAKPEGNPLEIRQLTSPESP